jgi:hypothetical protein
MSLLKAKKNRKIVFSFFDHSKVARPSQRQNPAACRLPGRVNLFRKWN